MGDTPTTYRIDYIELSVSSIPASKAFYGQAFGWTFTDWDPAYASFNGAGIDGGFQQVDEVVPSSTLIVLFADDLEACRAHILSMGVGLTKDIFSFPGGRRFEFTDPDGNPLAVWTGE